MRKCMAMSAGLLLALLLTAGFERYLSIQISDHSAAVRDYRTYERFWSSGAQKLIMDQNTLPVFGSSELVSLEDYEENVSSFLNGPDMNIVTIGAGSFQSLNHAIALGAIGDAVPGQKVALILSPQWFGEQENLKNAFPERFGEENLLEFLKNDKISDANKAYVLDRAFSLLSDSPMQYLRIEKYKKAYENRFSIDGIYTSIMRKYWNLRGKYLVYKQLPDMRKELPSADLSALDYDEMLKLAECQGEASCTNNDFGIYDSYWDTYVKETYEKGEVTEKTQIFTESVEYEDLRCFLNVAKELELEVILVSVPVHEKWYRYQGWLCDQYYSNIQTIAKEYPNISLVDLTEYADEKYFLKDVMHLGWKGWVRVNEALYHEFKK